MPDENKGQEEEKQQDDLSALTKTLLSKNDELSKQVAELQEQLKTVYKDKFFTKDKEDSATDEFDTYCSSRFDCAIENKK